MMTYLLSLAVLVTLPECELLLQLLNNGWNISLGHGWVHVDLAKTANGSEVELEFTSRG